jgi:replicative DNA helicase
VTLPHDLHAEAGVIGAVLAWGCLDEVLDTGLRPEHLSDERNRRTFAAAVNVAARGEPVDALTVALEVERQGLAWPEMRACLKSLQEEAPVGTVGVACAGQVRDLASRRALIVAGAELIRLGGDPSLDVDERRDRAEQLVLAATETAATTAPVPLGEVAVLALAELEARARGERRGVPTGFEDLDAKLGGLRPGQLVLVAARTSLGKSALALDIALRAAEAGHRVLVVSLEMAAIELGERMLARGGVSSAKLLTGRLDEGDFGRLREQRDVLDALPVRIDDDSTATVLGIRGKARRLAANGGLGLVVVDYLQLVRAEAGERHERRELAVAAVSRGLKGLARELGVPVLAVAQLSRDVEHRNDKTPVLADLRESGSLEQDADVVLLLHRAGAYDAAIDDGLAELHIAKNRNGPKGVMRVVWFPERMSFFDLEWKTNR